MPREGLLTPLGVVVLVLGLTLPPALAGEDPNESAVATTLAVQQALREANEHMERGHFAAAVHALEAQLPRINGNRAYLARLRDAYRGYIKELRLRDREGEAQTYLRRLEILDPGARLDFEASVRPATPPPAAAKAPTPPTNAELAAGSGAAARPQTVVRGMRGTEDPRTANATITDPFHPSQRLKTNASASLLEQAHQAWEARQYDTAGRLYAEANKTDPTSTSAVRDQWAYCKLHGVVLALRQPGTTPSGEQLEAEVREALALSSRLESQGKDLLARIRERRTNPSGAASPGGAAVAIRHQPAGANGLAVATSAHFRALHNQPRDVVEKVLGVAEATRTEVSRRWFGDDGIPWDTPCDLYLHASARDYSKATGKPANWPAHFTSQSEGSRVLSRRIDLHFDDPEALGSTLPHETTHAVLTGRFGGPDLPRWADEGIAVLSEPRATIDAHLRNLAQHRQEGLLYKVSDLLRLQDYPEGRRLGAFYAQSISLTEYLVNLKGPQAFVSFLNGAMRYGYETSLQRTYGLTTATLEQRWLQTTFGGQLQSSSQR